MGELQDGGVKLAGHQIGFAEVRVDYLLVVVLIEGGMQRGRGAIALTVNIPHFQTKTIY